MAAPSPCVLVVDDDTDVRESVADVLRLGGHQVSTARGGREALEYFASRPPPAMLLLDLMMPDMRGDEAWRLLHRRHGLAAERVVVMSAATDGMDRAAALGLGFLRKPMELDELLGLLRGRCPCGGT